MLKSFYSMAFFLPGFTLSDGPAAVVLFFSSYAAPSSKLLGKKKSPKSASSHSDIEEMTDSSLPSSPKLPHHTTTVSTPLLRASHSNSL